MIEHPNGTGPSSGDGSGPKQIEAIPPLVEASADHAAKFGEALNQLVRAAKFDDRATIAAAKLDLLELWEHKKAADPLPGEFRLVGNLHGVIIETGGSLNEDQAKSATHIVRLLNHLVKSACDSVDELSAAVRSGRIDDIPGSGSNAPSGRN